jgi:hypothetical protein
VVQEEAAAGLLQLFKVTEATEAIQAAAVAVVVQGIP